MGLWRSKFKHCAHESGVIVNQSKIGKDVVAFYPYVSGHPGAQLHLAALLAVMVYKLKSQSQHFLQSERKKEEEEQGKEGEESGEG